MQVFELCLSVPVESWWFQWEHAAAIEGKACLGALGQKPV